MALLFSEHRSVAFIHTYQFVCIASIWTRLPREESLGMGGALTQNANFTYDQATFIRVMINHSKAQATQGIPELSKNSLEKPYVQISQILKIKKYDV